MESRQYKKNSELDRAIANAVGPDGSTEVFAEPLAEPAVRGRYEVLDLVRGFAVCLMILSHGVKGLMSFEQMPAWGLVPVHLITKLSSSLFILVFGITLAMFFVPSAGTEAWPKKRKKLLVRGIVVLFWYKMLTILEMSHLSGREEILNALMYKSFPAYVEILGYYAIALLWIPWLLPAWKATHRSLKFLAPLVMFGIYVLASRNAGIFGGESLQAILVEHPNHYTWGQFSRAPLVFVGLLIGSLLQFSAQRNQPRQLPFFVMTGIAFALSVLFLHNADDELRATLVRIAMNEGKHPPELQFMLFSLAGAFAVLGLAFLGGNRLAKILGVFTTIGKHSLQAFVFHIVVLFVFYRYLFDYFHKVEYQFALLTSGILIVMTYMWIKITKWVRANS